MNIDMPIKQLMKFTCFLIAACNICDDDFKKKIILCQIKALARFFKGDELKEMIEMLKNLTKNPEVERIVEKYGEGFESIYFDGKADGFTEGIDDGKLQVDRNLLKKGANMEFILSALAFPLIKLKILKESFN